MNGIIVMNNGRMDIATLRFEKNAGKTKDTVRIFTYSSQMETKGTFCYKKSRSVPSTFGSLFSSSENDGFLPAKRSTPPNMATAPGGFLGFASLSVGRSSAFGFSFGLLAKRSSSSSLKRPRLDLPADGAGLGFPSDAEADLEGGDRLCGAGILTSEPDKMAIYCSRTENGKLTKRMDDKSTNPGRPRAEDARPSETPAASSGACQPRQFQSLVPRQASALPGGPFTRARNSFPGPNPTIALMRSTAACAKFV